MQLQLKSLELNGDSVSDNQVMLNELAMRMVSNQKATLTFVGTDGASFIVEAMLTSLNRTSGPAYGFRFEGAFTMKGKTHSGSMLIWRGDGEKFTNVRTDELTATLL